MSAEPVVELLDPDDDTTLDELLAFAATVGRPRAATGSEYRELMRGDAVAWQGFICRDASGRPCAAAQATVSPAIGLDQVQLNGFVAPGFDAAFVRVMDAVAAWSRERGAVCLTAHVSDPDERQIVAWQGAGFRQVGERARVVRDVTPADAETTLATIDGATIVALAERPELEAGADIVWRHSHEDVQSALRFDSADLRPLRVELGLDDGQAFPSLVLIAVADAGHEVVGLVVGVRRYVDRPTVVGHRMTAAARGWRGRGIAMALKREMIRRGATEGVTRLEASNDDGNAPMQAINERLGYRLDYRLVLLRRDL